MLLLLMALACSPGSGKGSFSRPVDGDSGAVGDGADGGVDPGDWTGVRDDEVESITGLPTDSSVLFNEDELPVFELEISDDSLANLRTDPYEYTEATLIWQGVRFGPIGIRTKGENSWRPFSEKSSFKLDFNRYDEGPDRFLGLKGLTFQGMNEDYSMMHERVAYRIYRMAGVPASRAHHAVIYVNGELYGLFTMIDTLDDIFLKGWFEEPLGSMWEQHDGDFTDAYVQNNLYFQHEVGEDDRTSLQAVADALESSGPEALAAAGEYLDWDAFHRYWAASSIAMNFDAYPFRFAGDDCHVYFDPARGKLVYLPHGADETFYYDDNFEGRATGHLSARCREVPECRDAWANRVYDTLELVESEDIAGYAQEVADQIRPWVEADPNRNYSLSNVNAYQADMINKLQNRRASVAYWIGERPEG